MHAIDTGRQLRDLLRTAEMFREAMIRSGATSHVAQSEYMAELRALERALDKWNYRADLPPAIAAARGRAAAMRISPPAGVQSSTAAANEFDAAIDLLEGTCEAMALIETLRAPEGASVTLCCDNPDFGMGPNNVIEVCDDWTFWRARRFEGDTMTLALHAAVVARDSENPVTSLVQDLRARKSADDGLVTVPKAQLDRLLDLLAGPNANG